MNLVAKASEFDCEVHQENCDHAYLHPSKRGRSI